MISWYEGTSRKLSGKLLKMNDNLSIKSEIMLVKVRLKREKVTIL